MIPYLEVLAPFAAMIIKQDRIIQRRQEIEKLRKDRAFLQSLDWTDDQMEKYQAALLRIERQEHSHCERF